MNGTDRYNRAIIRNLYEVHRCLSNRNAVNALGECAPVTSWTFFSYAYLALYNDMVAHAIKVCDKNKDTASFFYLYRCNQIDLEKLLTKYDLLYGDIDLLASKLKGIRDRTHFHIDKKGVFNPSDIWGKASIKGSLFDLIMDKLWVILNELHISAYNKPFNLSIYVGTDVKAIIDAVKKDDIKI